MAWWKDFATSIAAVPTALKRLTGGGSYLSEEELVKEQTLHNTVKDALADIDSKLSNVPGFGVTKKITKGVGDKLLQGAVKLNQEVLSPYIFRPISTAALLTDFQSPLYKKGEYEEGFQFDDIKAAYNRSAKVSAMQALTMSDLTPISGISAVVLPMGGIDVNKIDLWNDESIKQNYVDNAVGRWFTGIGDFIVGNAALGGVGKIAGIAARAGGTKAGLYTKRKTVEQLELDMNNGIDYASTNGVTGTQTISGNHMVVLAESKDWGSITNLVSKYSTNEKLIPLIHEASDARVVKDLILADKGNLAALDRLASTAPDKLFDLSNTQGQLQSKFLQTGSSYLPEGAAVPRLKAAFDNAIATEPQFVKIRDAFFDPNYNLTVGGKLYNPLEPIIGKAAAIRAGEKIRSFKSVSAYREFDKFADIFETSLGKGVGRISVKLVKFGTRQAEYKPLGFVTFSGVRPLDGRVELNAFLNNIKLFRDGAAKIETAPNVFEKVADIRRAFEEQYMKALGKNEVEVLENIDASIGRMLAYKAGIYDEREIASHIRAFRGNVNNGINSVKQNGFGIAHDGSQILVDPQTIRQMTESYRFTPWDAIESQFIATTEKSALKAGAKTTVQIGQQVFRDLNRLWTFDVLVRPMYIIKQSIGEPIVSATIAQGMDFLWQDARYAAGNALRNFGNWGMGVGSKIKNRSERIAVNRAVEDKKAMYARAAAIKDSAQASLEDLLSGNTSPATKAQHLESARQSLKAASSVLDEIELDLRSAVVPFGVKEAIPSATTLERRIAFLEAKPNIAPKTADIAIAKAAIANYRNVINKMATNKQVIIDADNAIAAAYKNVDNALNELGPALKAQADVWGKSAKFKKRWFGRENQYRMVNGQYMAIDSFVTGDKNFSAAIRAEVSNARTTDMNFLGELSVGTRKSLVERKIPLDIVRVSDPLYFGELEYIANRVMRGDPLIDLILGNTPITELQRWAASDAGITYLRAFDVFDPKQVNSYLADKVALVNRTFPSFEARSAILNREVTGQELQTWLAPYVDQLYDIVPSNYNYGAGNLGVGKYAELSNAVNNFSAKIFRKMASAENPIRNAFFDNVAIDAIARKAEYLMQQGIEMTPARWNALRQSAGREAIQELEKTVYTVRRENRLLHNARFAVAFPTATVNAFYRYGRLAAKNPTRALTFASNYGKMFQSFGVDENGNPTNNLADITHLILPGTKEMGLGFMDEGIALNSKSLGFLLNQPSPSFISALSVGKVMQKFPGTEAGIKEALTINGTNYFDIIFPYGAPTSLTKQLTPPWANSLWNAATGNQGKADYLASWRSVYNYHKMLVEMGIEKEFPSDVDIEKEVKALWAEKFISGFASIAGVPFKVETNPMRLSTNLYYKLLEKYNKLGYSTQDARDAAGDEMLGIMGTKFMLDRITFSGSTKNISIPATYEAYERVFKDNDELVGKLASIQKGDIGLVSLLTADLSRSPAEQSNNILSILSNPNLTLPGTSQRINDFKLTPQEVERERMKQRTWDQYNLVRDALEAKITDGKTLRAHPELKAPLEQLVETTFKNQSQAWYDEYQLSASGDTSYKYARALTLITQDPKFMGKQQNNQFWKDTRLFMKARSIFVTFYQSLPDYDPRKAVIRDGYNQWVAQYVKQWDPNLETLIKNYFDNDSLKAVN
jgi:hypothetical protein